MKYGLSKDLVESEVLRIREFWKIDRNNIEAPAYTVKNPEAGVTAYYDGQGQLVDLESLKEKNADGFTKTFEYRNGKLLFAFYESPDVQYRMYFKDGSMFRLDKRAGQDHGLLDAAYEEPEFLQWEEAGLGEGQKLYDESLNR